MLGRGLPEDRPARAGMLSAVEDFVEQIAEVYGEPIDLSRIPLDDAGRLRRDPARRHRRRLPDREPRADAEPAADEAGESRRSHASRSRSCGPGRSRGRQFTRTSTRARSSASIRRTCRHRSTTSLLREPLRETHGVVVFQDQVLEVAMALAGFTIGEAEGLRRAMSRKRSEEAIEAFGGRFIEGARGEGVDAETADSGSTTSSPRSPASASRSRTRPPSGCSPFYRLGVATAPLSRRVPLLAPERPADGVLPAREPRCGTRNGRGCRGAPAGHQPE